ncbi:putative protein art3, partial [Rhizoclosmatium hyalinum]
MGSEDDDKLRAQQDFEDDNDHDVDEWIEDDTSTVVCLFCAATSTSIDDTLKHLNEAHHFDLVNEGKTLGLDFYEGIRLVNYIRKQVKENASFKLSSVSENTAEWIKDDAYLIP